MAPVVTRRLVSTVVSTGALVGPSMRFGEAAIFFSLRTVNEGLGQGWPQSLGQDGHSLWGLPC